MLKPCASLSVMVLEGGDLGEGIRSRRGLGSAALMEWDQCPYKSWESTGFAPALRHMAT